MVQGNRQQEIGKWIQFPPNPNVKQLCLLIGMLGVNATQAKSQFTPSKSSPIIAVLSFE